MWWEGPIINTIAHLHGVTSDCCLIPIDLSLIFWCLHCWWQKLKQLWTSIQQRPAWQPVPGKLTIVQWYQKAQGTLSLVLFNCLPVLPWCCWLRSYNLLVLMVAFLPFPLLRSGTAVKSLLLMFSAEVSGWHSFLVAASSYSLRHILPFFFFAARRMKSKATALGYRHMITTLHRFSRFHFISLSFCLPCCKGNKGKLPAIISPSTASK